MLLVYKTNLLTHCLLLNIIITELIRYDSDMQIRSRCTCHCHVKHILQYHWVCYCYDLCISMWCVMWLVRSSQHQGILDLFGSTMPALQELATRISYKSYTESACESNFSDFGYIVGEKQIYRMNFSTQRKLVYLYCNLRLLD